MSDSTNVRGFSARRVERKTHNFLRQKKEEREKKVIKEKEVLQKRKEWTIKKEEKVERRNQTSGNQPAQTTEGERERRARLLVEQISSGEPRQEPHRYTAGYQKQYEQQEEDDRAAAPDNAPRRDGFWRAGKWVQREQGKYPQQPRPAFQKEVGPDGKPTPDGRTMRGLGMSRLNAQKCAYLRLKRDTPSNYHLETIESESDGYNRTDKTNGTQRFVNNIPDQLCPRTPARESPQMLSD